MCTNGKFFWTTWVGVLLLSLGNCTGDEATQSPAPEANYVIVETQSASMAPALGLCYYVQHYPEYRGLPGFSFVGRVETVLDGGDLTRFREENCFENFTGCGYYSVAEVSVEDMLMGDPPKTGRVKLMIAPLRAEEVSKWYLGSRVVVFARNFLAGDNGAGLTNYYATYLFDKGYAFATSAEGLKYDFGTAAVREDELLSKVRELNRADPAACPWDQYGKLKGNDTIVPFPDASGSEFTDGPRY